jgi:hypothetical protein
VSRGEDRSGGPRARDIERAVTHALSRRGVAGAVVVREGLCELHSPTAPVVAIEIDWIDQWDLLPSDIQGRHAERAATRLSRALDEVRGRRTSTPRNLALLAKRAFFAGLILAAAGATGWWLWQAGFFGREPAPGAPPERGVDTPLEAVFADQEREKLSCEAGRKRLYEGADMGVDVGGWVVELFLARVEGGGRMADDPAVNEVLDQVGGASAGAVLARAEPRALLGHDGLIVRLDREWVTAFFHAESRKQVEDFADRMAGASGADYAALYARCAHLTTHDVGAWYRGRDERMVSVALLYAAGAFADPPAFARAALEPEGGLLPALARRAEKLDTRDFEARVRPFGGRVLRDGSAVSLRFAFGGPTRAQHLSRELGKALGL